MGSRTVSNLAVSALGLVVLSSCGDNNTGSTADGTCTMTIEFRGQAYTATGNNSQMKLGRKLGTASPVHCPGDDADGPADKLTIYAVIGTPPNQAVFAKPNVGLMKVSELEEDQN